MSSDISRFDQTVAIGLGMAMASQRQQRAQQRASLIAAYVARGYDIAQATAIVDQWLWEQDAPRRASDKAFKMFAFAAAALVLGFILVFGVIVPRIPGTHANYCRTHAFECHQQEIDKLVKSGVIEDDSGAR